MADEQLRPDIAAAADRMEVKTGAKREIRSLITQLWEGEQVDQMVAGTYAGGTGLVALTDRRLLFWKDGWTSKSTVDFPLERISSVEWKSGMLTGTLTVFASGNKTEITNVGKNGGKTIAEAVRNRMAPGRAPAAAPVVAPPAPVAPAPSGPAQTEEDVYAALEKLGALHERGILTAEEFAAKKTELLGRI